MTVWGGTVWVTVDAVVVTINVRVGVDSVWVGVDSVCAVVVEAVGVGVVVVVVAAARVTVRVVTAALFPPPPQEVRATDASTPIDATATSLAATPAWERKRFIAYAFEYPLLAGRRLDGPEHVAVDVVLADQLDDPVLPEHRENMRLHAGETEHDAARFGELVQLRQLRRPL